MQFLKIFTAAALLCSAVLASPLEVIKLERRGPSPDKINACIETGEIHYSTYS